MKFFVYGLLLGLLFAPASGQETRKRLLTWVSNTGKELFGMGEGESGSGTGTASA